MRRQRATPGRFWSVSAVFLRLGLIHAGLPGALAAWLGFTAPAALAMVGFGYGVALAGVNAAVVGPLLAALYTPVWTSAIGDPRDVALALGAFLLLSVWRGPPWLVVALGAGAGGLLG